MSKLVKKVSNLFIDDVGRVCFTVGVVISDIPVYYVYRTLVGRDGLQIFSDVDGVFHTVFNVMVFSVTASSLQSIRKWIYDNYDNFVFKYPMILGG